DGTPGRARPARHAAGGAALLPRRATRAAVPDRDRALAALAPARAQRARAGRGRERAALGAVRAALSRVGERAPHPRERPRRRALPVGGGPAALADARRAPGAHDRRRQSEE